MGLHPNWQCCVALSLATDFLDIHSPESLSISCLALGEMVSAGWCLTDVWCEGWFREHCWGLKYWYCRIYCCALEFLWMLQSFTAIAEQWQNVHGQFWIMIVSAFAGIITFTTKYFEDIVITVKLMEGSVFDRCIFWNTAIKIRYFSSKFKFTKTLIFHILSYSDKFWACWGFYRGC